MSTEYAVAQDVRGQEGAECAHLDQVHAVAPSTLDGCEDCLKTGDSWVHLRECLACGHVGCCDSSPNKHATAHWKGAGHPVVRSFEPGEEWGWCYDDQLFLLPVA
ncbi:MAG: UBP-type zinc finger domain-containing protein [Streptomycetaceae bacterium]|nr:UBP-type zinc finger domain-containing protein [Streptomycetaceae bacterium]